MKKSVLGGILSVALIVAALLATYVTFSRTSSGYQAKQMQNTMAFIDGRLEALEKQRDLLRDSAAALEEQAAVLNKRVGMVDAEIRNMRDGIVEGRRSARDPLLSLKHFRFTTVSGLAVIACLILIWFLYSGVRGRETSGEEGEGTEAAGEAAPSGSPEVLQPGSLREEEFQPVAETGDIPVEAAPADESAGGGAEGKEDPEDSPPETEDAPKEG